MARDGRRRRLHTKCKWSHCYFFPAVVIRWQCGSIRDCTARYRHPLKLGGQQWRSAERKQRRRRRRSVGRRSSRRRNRSSASHVSKIASHGPAAFEDGSTIFRDGPAQVNDGGRRRDGGASFAIAFTSTRRRRRETGNRTSRRRMQPADLRLSHLADALGVLAISSRNFHRRRGANPRRRFLCDDMKRAGKSSTKNAVAATKGAAAGEQGGAARKADRALLLADAERLENFDHARRVRAALCRAPRRHFKGRAVRAAFFGDLAEQPHSGDRRSRRSGRSADRGIRIRRDLAISRPQNRKILSARRTRARRGRGVAVLAGRRARPDGGTGDPLPPLRAGADYLCDRALYRRGQPPLRRHE